MSFFKGGFSRAVLALLLAAILTACGMQHVPSGLPVPQPGIDPGSRLPQAVQGETIGNGETRLALLLPLSGDGNGARVAAELRNAAQMAVDDAGADSLQIVVKDTAGREAGAAAAAQSAAAEGAALVLGPLFAPNVRQVASVLSPQRIPVMAFSSDRRVAAPGVYLNSYLPGGLVDRILTYAVGQGFTRVVAVVPNGAAGDLAETEARRTLQGRGGELVALARYDYDGASLQAAVREVAVAVDQADAVFLPDGGNTPGAVASTLTSLGVDLSGKKLLGTGQWASADLSDPSLQGAWFADTDHARLEAYKRKYAQRFGAEPSVTSALAYDAVILAARLARQGGAAAFTPANLQVTTGYAGYTGTFRFRADGTTQRNYAVYEVADGQARLLSPASGNFAGF
ncbi:penicillin-binding protein activator [Nitratireductor sp. GCM10026969]|uniref:penicillin-binding protein activator n=1 Tax=Nitratireductor sp. GCM10026969 TaxID=3252645 RepID=UPI00360FE5D3